MLWEVSLNARASRVSLRNHLLEPCLPLPQVVCQVPGILNEGWLLQGQGNRRIFFFSPSRCSRSPAEDISCHICDLRLRRADISLLLCLGTYTKLDSSQLLGCYFHVWIGQEHCGYKEFALKDKVSPYTNSIPDSMSVELPISWSSKWR